MNPPANNRSTLGHSQQLAMATSAPILLLIIALHLTLGGRITFWSDANFQGTEYYLDMRPTVCYKLGVASDRLSSLVTNGQCLDLYTRDDCYGGFFRSEALSTSCHENLADCDMNDRVSSVRLCPKCRYSCYGPPAEDGSDDLEEELVALLELSDANQCQCHCKCSGMCISQNYQY